MRRPPAAVAFIARTHWLMSAAITGFIAALHAIVRDSSVIELSATTYALALGLAALYALAGALGWLGLPGGRLLNRVCSLFYFIRPPLGVKISDLMRSDEYRAHFTRPPPPP